MTLRRCYHLPAASLADPPWVRLDPEWPFLDDRTEPDLNFQADT